MWETARGREGNKITVRWSPPSGTGGSRQRKQKKKGLATRKARRGAGGEGESEGSLSERRM